MTCERCRGEGGKKEKQGLHLLRLTERLGEDVGIFMYDRAGVVREGSGGIEHSTTGH